MSEQQHMAALNAAELQNARTRKLLDENPMARRRAVCMFPLVVAQIASDMRRLMDLVEQKGRSDSVSDHALDYMERVIRDEYRRHFGCELGNRS